MCLYVYPAGIPAAQLKSNAVWDKIDSEKKLIADPEQYPAVLQTAKNIFAEEVEIFHVQPRSDPAPILNSPITERATCILKDLATKDEFEKVMEEMIGALADVSHGATWGPVLEKPDTYLMLVGWENVEVSR